MVLRRQEDAVRQKRRERDAQLKEQKAQALKRKQVTESELEEGQHEKKKLKTANEDTTPKTNGVEEHWEKPALPSEYKLQQLQQLHQNAFDDHHAEDDERNTTPTSTTLSAAPATYSVPPPPRRSKIPLLLPDSLLEEVASRGSPPPSLVLPKIHKKAADFEYEETNGSLSLSNSKRERKQTYIKKGPISVAVLDPAQTHSRKSMAPKAIAGVKNVKNAWMFKGKGNHIEREKPRTGFGTSVGGFFKRGF